MVLRILGFMCAFTLFYSSNAQAKVVEYELSVAKGSFEHLGEVYDNKVLVNGALPAPLLVFNMGDTARIKVKNNTDEHTLIHWHGLLIKNSEDGVPYVNSLPIKPGAEKIYEFDLRQTGTYWYHSHVMFQEQDGVYGSFVILPEDKTLNTRNEDVVILSDVSKQSGKTIHRNLKKDGEYYDVLKGTVQSWFKALRSGTWPTKFRNSLQRMEGMDYADIAYDFFAANGKKENYLFENVNENKKVRVRVINGSASSIFKLTYGNDYIEVVGADGLDVEPVKVKVLPISVAETYDILVPLKKDKKIELRATSFDNTGFSTTWIGGGAEKIEASKMEHANPIGVSMGEMMGMPKMGFWREFIMSYKNEFRDYPTNTRPSFSETYQLPEMKTLKPMMAKMNKSSHKNHQSKQMGMQYRIMNMTPSASEENTISKQGKEFKELTYDLLETKDPINVVDGAKLRTYNFTLNGNMGTYVWSINGRTLGPETYLKIKKGERVRFVMKNTTMMNHPMHLHGHFFRVMTSKKENSVLKHTVNVSPLSTTVIEFDANEEKDWFFHCHILYHMMDGMARVVRYEDNPGPERIEKARKNSKEFNYTDSLFLSNKILAQSNYSRIEGRVFNSHYLLSYDFLGNYDGNIEGEIHLARTLTRFLSLYVGGRYEQENSDESVSSPTLGFTWVLPLNISIDVKYQPLIEDKVFEIEFANEIQLTSKLQLNFEYSSIRNFYTELEWRQTKNLSFSANYNETFNSFGAGLGYTY